MTATRVCGRHPLLRLVHPLFTCSTPLVQQGTVIPWLYAGGSCDRSLNTHTTSGSDTAHSIIATTCQLPCLHTRSHSQCHTCCVGAVAPLQGDQRLGGCRRVPLLLCTTLPSYEHKPSTPAQNGHLTQRQHCRGTAENSSGCLAQCVAVGQFEPGSTSCQPVYGLQAAG